MKTIVFSMITFFTSVVMMSTNTFAAELSEGAINALLKRCESKTGTEKDRCEREGLAAVGGGGGAAGGVFDDQCQQAEKGMAEPLKAFNKACGIFKLKGVSCAEKVNGCPGNVEEEDETESKKGKTVDRSKYSVCPIPAIEDAKKAKERIKELKSEIETVEADVERAKEKLEEAKKNVETAEAERAEANNEREAKYEADMKEKGLEQTEKSKAAQKKIDEIEKAMRELEQTKNDQDVQYSVDLAKIEGICEEIAEKALSAKITAEVNNVSKNQQKQRNLQAQLTLKSNGRTAENEGFRKREIARCRADEAKWKKPIELLNLNYKNNRIKIDAAIQEMITQRTKTYTELNSTLPQEQQKEAQQLQSRYEKDLATIKSKFDTKIGQCGNFQAMRQNGQPNQTTMPNGCTGLQAVVGNATASLANLEAKLSDKESDLEYFTELLEASSSVVSTTEADGVDLMSAAEDYKQAIISVGTYCSDRLGAPKAKEYMSILNAMDTGSSTTKGESSDAILFQNTADTAEGQTSSSGSNSGNPSSSSSAPSTK